MEVRQDRSLEAADSLMGTMFESTSLVDTISSHTFSFSVQVVRQSGIKIYLFTWNWILTLLQSSWTRKKLKSMQFPSCVDFSLYSDPSLFSINKNILPFDWVSQMLFLSEHHPCWLVHWRILMEGLQAYSQTQRSPPMNKGTSLIGQSRLVLQFQYVEFPIHSRVQLQSQGTNLDSIGLSYFCFLTFCCTVQLNIPCQFTLSSSACPFMKTIENLGDVQLFSLRGSQYELGKGGLSLMNVTKSQTMYVKNIKKKMAVPIKLQRVETGRDLGTGMKEKMSTADITLTTKDPSLFYLIMLLLSASFVDTIELISNIITHLGFY